MCRWLPLQKFKWGILFGNTCTCTSHFLCEQKCNLWVIIDRSQYSESVVFLYYSGFRSHKYFRPIGSDMSSVAAFHSWGVVEFLRNPERDLFNFLNRQSPVVFQARSEYLIFRAITEEMMELQVNWAEEVVNLSFNLMWCFMPGVSGKTAKLWLW